MIPTLYQVSIQELSTGKVLDAAVVMARSYGQAADAFLKRNAIKAGELLVLSEYTDVIDATVDDLRQPAPQREATAPADPLASILEGGR